MATFYKTEAGWLNIDQMVSVLVDIDTASGPKWAALHIARFADGSTYDFKRGEADILMEWLDEHSIEPDVET